MRKEKGYIRWEITDKNAKDQEKTWFKIRTINQFFQLYNKLDDEEQDKLIKEFEVSLKLLSATAKINDSLSNKKTKYSAPVFHWSPDKVVNFK